MEEANTSRGYNMSKEIITRQVGGCNIYILPESELPFHCGKNHSLAPRRPVKMSHDVYINLLLGYLESSTKMFKEIYLYTPDLFDCNVRSLCAFKVRKNDTKIYSGPNGPKVC